MRRLLFAIILLSTTKPLLSVQTYQSWVKDSFATSTTDNHVSLNPKSEHRDKFPTQFSRTFLDSQEIVFEKPLSSHSYLRTKKKTEPETRFQHFNFTTNFRQSVTVGLSGDNCSSSSECEGTRVCKAEVLNATRCVPESGSLEYCQTGNDCPVDEYCIGGISEEYPDFFCLSKGYAFEVGLILGPPSAGGSALTGDECESSADCKDSRVCVRGVFNSIEYPFRCWPFTGRKQECTSSDDCDTGEACFPTYPEPFSCFSTEFAEEVGVKGPSSPGGNAMNFEKCSTSADCEGSRVCLEGMSGESRCSFPHRSEGCNSSSDCTKDEGCLRLPEGISKLKCIAPKFLLECISRLNCIDGMNGLCIAIKGETICADKAIVKELGLDEIGDSVNSGDEGPKSSSVDDEDNDDEDSDDDNTNEPCIGIHSLTHFSREELLFEKDVLANVLCDGNESCATPGHMVRYRGEAIMMKSYCEIIGGCTKRVMYVNSPSYRTGLTVASRSENMVFTTFSARYVTRAEEGMLALVIKLGF